MYSLSELNNRLSYDDLFLFLSKFSIYRSSYNKQIGNKWVNIKSFLSNEILLNSINSLEKSNVAYFSCYKTNFFAIDIDNHDGTKDIHKACQEAISILGQPSLVSQSPRGTHLYYSLKERFDADLIVRGLKQKFKNSLYGFEFKPTSDSALRTINFNCLLSPTTFDSISFSDAMNQCVTYNLNEIFFDVNFHSFKSLVSVASNDKWITISNGETNEALNYYIPLWKGQGASENECVSMFISKLSSNYHGECLNRMHVKKRVHCFFKNDILFTYKKPNLSVFRETYKQAIDCALELYEKSSNTNYHNMNLRKEKIENMMILVLLEKEKTIERFKNPKIRSYYSSLYPFWLKEVRSGNTPLPMSLFKAQYNNYNSILNFLITIGFLKRRNGRSYDSERHSCQHYYVNSEFYKQHSEYSYSKVYSLTQITQLVKYSTTLSTVKSFVDGIVSTVKTYISKLTSEPYELRSYHMFLGFNIEEQDLISKSPLVFNG